MRHRRPADGADKCRLSPAFAKHRQGLADEREEEAPATAGALVAAKALSSKAEQLHKEGSGRIGAFYPANLRDEDTKASNSSLGINIDKEFRYALSYKLGATYDGCSQPRIVPPVPARGQVPSSSVFEALRARLEATTMQLLQGQLDDAACEEASYAYWPLSNKDALW